MAAGITPSVIVCESAELVPPSSPSPLAPSARLPRLLGYTVNLRERPDESTVAWRPATATARVLE
jgi:hypothetical protein